MAVPGRERRGQSLPHAALDTFVASAAVQGSECPRTRQQLGRLRPPILMDWLAYSKVMFMWRYTWPQVGSLAQLYGTPRALHAPKAAVSRTRAPWTDRRAAACTWWEAQGDVHAPSSSQQRLLAQHPPPRPHRPRKPRFRNLASEYHESVLKERMAFAVSAQLCIPAYTCDPSCIRQADRSDL